MVALAKIQYTRDDEPTISCINQDKTVDNEVYYSMSALSFLTFLFYCLCSGAHNVNNNVNDNNNVNVN
jgi:hypothetical protein